MTGIYTPRKLAERANIVLEFPTENDRIIRAYIPILENPEISEAQRARLTPHAILSRPGNLFTYTGADSRNISIRFNITLPNILGYINEEGLIEKFSRQFSLFHYDKELQKRVFLSSKGELNSADKINTSLFDKSGLARKQYQNLIGRNGSLPSSIIDNISNFVIGNILGEASNNYTGPVRMDNAINLYLLWINLIRCTTLNNSKNTSYGPPLVRLNYGTMFNNVPFVCSEYGVRINTAAGYDKDTLTPRQVEIFLNLHENRVGDFDEYKRRDAIKGDNVNGWEAVIYNDTLDPYNDDWSLEDGYVDDFNNNAS